MLFCLNEILKIILNVSYREMSRQYFHDAPDGDTILFDVIDEKPEVPYRLSVFSHETYEQKMEIMNNLPEYKCREKDLFLFSYPKTGNNLFFFLVFNCILNMSRGKNKSF